MKTTTNNFKNTITATETVAGEASRFTLTVMRKNGATIVSRPLVDPVPVPVPVPTPTPVPAPAPTPAPAPSVVASIRVTPATVSLAVGATAVVAVVPLDAAGNPVTGKLVVYHSENAGVASWAAGVVKANGAGSVRLLAVADGVTGYLGVTVTSGVPLPPPPDPTPLPGPTPVPTPTPPPTPGAAPTPPELPRSVPTAPTVSTTIRRVAAGGDLQAALNLGGTILLAPGSVFTGEFTLPPGVTGELRTDIPKTAADALDRRMTPTKAAALKLAKVVAPGNQPCIRTVSLDTPTKSWILSDLEVTGTLPKTSVQYGLLGLGDGGWADGGETQLTLARVATGFLLDRVYVHGHDQLNCTRGIALNSGQTVIRSSWISEIHAAGFDSQAVCGWNGPGPYLIEDCYLEGAGENVMFGGADPGIPGLVPSDITIRRNHFKKPLTWKGGPWSVKNLFELKSAQRVLVDQSIFENNWPAAQEGSAIVLKSNANGQQYAWEGTRDVTMRQCIIRNAPVGLALQAADDSYGWTGFVHTQRVRIEQCLFSEIGAEGRASLMLLTHDLADIAVTRCTFTHAAGAKGLVATMAYAGGGARRMAWTDNALTAAAGYAWFYDGGIVHAAALTAMVGDKSWTVTGNIIAGVLAEYIPLNPIGNQYPATLPTTTTAGVDMAELTRRTAGVVVP